MASVGVWTLALLSIAFLIVVHEAGHYFVARRCGMRIERFSIGFGPAIKALSWKSKKTGTTFQIAPIPFGGFVEIKGMNIAEEVDPDDATAYPNRPTLQRFITIFAGPATNYLSAIVLAFLLYNCHGMNSSYRWFGVGAIDKGKGYDAEGKLKEGDRILAVDHKQILAHGSYQLPNGRELDGDADQLVNAVNAKNGAPVMLTVRRDGKEMDIQIQPKAAVDKDGKPVLDKGKPVYHLGIYPIPQADVLDVGIGESTIAALEYPVDETRAIGDGLYRIVTRKDKADPGSVVRITQEFAAAWKQGAPSGFELLMALSVYLGLFNLFPLPALDGGRLVFLTYELITRRRANPRIESMVHMAGIMVLFVVMIFVVMRDFHAFGWGTS